MASKGLGGVCVAIEEKGDKVGCRCFLVEDVGEQGVGRVVINLVEDAAALVRPKAKKSIVSLGVDVGGK